VIIKINRDIDKFKTQKALRLKTTRLYITTR